MEGYNLSVGYFFMKARCDDNDSIDYHLNVVDYIVVEDYGPYKNNFIIKKVRDSWKKNEVSLFIAWSNSKMGYIANPDDDIHTTVKERPSSQKKFIIIIHHVYFVSSAPAIFEILPCTL